MLEAEPGELRGEGDTELATHLRECPRCRAIASRLVQGQAELGLALSCLRPGTDVDEALRALRMRGARGARASRRRRSWGIGVPLAAAAALAGLLLLRSPDAGRVMPGTVVPLPAPRFEPLVEVASQQNVMVFESRGGAVKVIWFY